MTNKYFVDEHLRNNPSYHEVNSYTMSPFNSSVHKDHSPFNFEHENNNNYDYEFSQVPMASTFEKKVDEYLKTRIQSSSNRKTKPIDERFYTALPEIKNKYKKSKHELSNNQRNWMMNRSNSVI